ncbi:MAG TPA: hypothetical protein VN729_06255, partial [Ktedonobacteraceae bacterium]|nr:hypothetical protein [Ktedonobacteraceae bacterium]
HMEHILYREDREGVMSGYIQRILAGEMDLADPVPEDVQDLLKTALPSDFHNSPHLEWRYLVLNGRVWQIDEAPDDYTPQSADEQAVLEMIRPEPNPFDELPGSTDEAQVVEQAPVSKNSVVR